MQDRMRRRAIPISFLMAAALCAPTLCTTGVRADDTEACIASHEQSQVLRRDGKLKKAREAMITCARDVCPKVLRKDCSAWLAEADESLPSVVVEAKGPDGNDVIEMKVFIDGELLISKLEGRAVTVDPGVHVFRFELPGVKPREEKIVIAEGQKNRKISVDFSPPKPAATATGAGTAPPGVPEEPGKRPTPAVVYVLGGVGLVALGASAFFEARGLGQRSDLDAKGCKPACDKDEVDAAKQSILIGDIALGAGVASLGVAAIVYLARPTIKPKKEKAWNFDVRQVQGGAMAGFRGSF
jgi:hypothetical protein